MWYITIFILDTLDYIGNNLIKLTSSNDVLFSFNFNNHELTTNIINSTNFIDKLNLFTNVFKEISFFIYFQIIVNLLIMYSFFYNFWIDTLFTNNEVKYRKMSNQLNFYRFKKKIRLML